MKTKCLSIVGILGIALTYIMLVGSCASIKGQAAKPLPKPPGDEGSPKVLAVKVTNLEGKETRISVLCDKKATYTLFKVAQPIRVVLDVLAIPDEKIKHKMEYEDKNVTKIALQESEAGKSFTRIVIYLKRQIDYSARAEGNNIILTLVPSVSSHGSAKIESPSPSAGQHDGLQEARKGAKGPRIFFKPAAGPNNEVLGIDYVLLDQGRSRLIITTKARAQYKVRLKGKKGLSLTLKNCTIPSLLRRHLDTLYFKGAVRVVKTHYFHDERKVIVDIGVKEMVPFHVSQKKGAILVEFEPTEVPPPKLRLKPMEASIQGRGTKQSSKGSSSSIGAGSSAGPFSGQEISIAFRNETLQNILYFFSRTLDINMVWNPADIGNKRMSVDLDNVPWDQAIDITLRSAGLTYRIEGDVWYVLSRKKAEDFEKERTETRLQMLKLKQTEKSYEPRITAYIQARYRKAGDLIKIVNKILEREKTTPLKKEEVPPYGPNYGEYTIAELTSTNTIIASGLKETVKRIKELVSKADVPQRQVMIEARIVEATTSFSRELGLNWSGSYETIHNVWGGTAGGTYSYNFSTNLGLTGSTTAGIGFINTAATKLLNAQIALGEAENELKTLSAPKIVTLNGHPAKIDQGTQVFEPSGRDNNGNLIYKAVDATLTLDVTPVVMADDVVNLDIKVHESEPDYANARGESIPIKTKKITTSLTVSSGDTIVIGGIYKEDKNIREEGTPFLRDIPVIGWLFKQRSQGKSKTELLVFITPTVISRGSQRPYE